MLHDELLASLKQDVLSGGAHTPSAARLLMLSLALLIEAKDILETGFDAGYTTKALAMSGANVTAVDDYTEYGDVKHLAVDLCAVTPNIKLIVCDALDVLLNTPTDSYDMIFIDDNHTYEHVEREAKEVKRILRPGGIALFHDTIIHGIGEILDKVFPDYPKISYLPCYTAYPGYDHNNFGLGIVFKPKYKE